MNWIKAQNSRIWAAMLPSGERYRIEHIGAALDRSTGRYGMYRVTGSGRGMGVLLHHQFYPTVADAKKAVEEAHEDFRAGGLVE